MVGLMVSEKIIILCASNYKSMGAINPNCGPHGFRESILWLFSHCRCMYLELLIPKSWPILTRDLDWQDLCREPED